MSRETDLAKGSPDLVWAGGCMDEQRVMKHRCMHGSDGARLRVHVCVPLVHSDDAGSRLERLHELGAHVLASLVDRRQRAASWCSHLKPSLPLQQQENCKSEV